MRNSDVLKIAVSFFVGCIVSALVVGRELHPTYYEANDLLNAMWRNSPSNNFETSIEFSVRDLVPAKFVDTCHFSARGGNVIDYVKSQHSLKAKAETFVNGTVIDDWDTEHLFKILFVAADGDAIMWNFDERLYKVSRYDESKNCFKTNDLAIVVNSKTLSEGKRITQISLVKK